MTFERKEMWDVLVNDSDGDTEIDASEWVTYDGGEGPAIITGTYSLSGDILKIEGFQYQRQ
jgi:hypothetical protein